MELSAIYQIFLNCQGVTTDSRNCPQGSLFIALKGESFNGNTYASKALEQGCSYAIIDEKEYFINNDKRYILVENSLNTLQELAHFHRKELKTPIIGITGTNGKTTTKELIAAVLSKRYNILYTQGNLNNHIGVPLTLLQLTNEHEIAVIEMGANHPKEIEFLSNLVEPNFGIITNVGKAHLEGFGSFEGVIKTKGELYDYLRKSENSTVFIHNDNSYLLEISKGLNLVHYGTNDSLYINGKVTKNAPYLSFEWKNGKNGEKHLVDTQLIGEYNFPNALAAITIGHFMKVSSDNIDLALTEYTPQNNRSQLKKTNSNTLIIDAYNANPTSMMAALANFHNMEMKNKTLILGDMKELGKDSKIEHQKIVDYIKQCNFNNVILVGDEFMSCSHSYTTYPSVNELIDALQKEKIERSTILIKGSNGIKLNKVVDYL